MGQGQQKPTINPNSSQTNLNGPNNAIKDDKIISYISEALRNCSNGGYVQKDSFNQVLAVLENFGFKRLRDTPLADRLFALLDEDKSGRITEQKFRQNINEILNDKNTALMYTFRAYDSDGDNRISRKQFIQFIEDTWRAAFRILAQNCDGKNNGRLTIRDLQNFAASKVQNLNQHSGKLFSKLDSNKSGFIEFQAFKQFATNSGYNDIIASVDIGKVVLPINLTSIYDN